jgi:hypothetical protein
VVGAAVFAVELPSVARLLLWAILVAANTVCAWASAAPEHARVTLTYELQEAPASCPDEATFRGLVSARLGYDPFVTAGALALTVDFRRRGNEAVGRLNLTGENREKRGERTLRAGADDCFELATSMALIAAVAVDPDAVKAHAQSESSTATPETSPPPPAPPKVEPKPVDRSPPPVHAPLPPPAVVDQFERGVRVELGAVLPVGIVPAPRGGIRAGATADIGAWSIGAEGAFLFPSSRDSAYGEISAYVLSASLVACAHPVASESWLLSFCAVGSVGALRSTAARVTRPVAATDLFATTGPRIAAVVMLSRAVGLGAHAEMPVTLSRVHLHIDDGGQRREVWAQSPVGFLGGLSLVARFQ